MKITKDTLKKIIKEEYDALKSQREYDPNKVETFEKRLSRRSMEGRGDIAKVTAKKYYKAGLSDATLNTEGSGTVSGVVIGVGRYHPTDKYFQGLIPAQELSEPFIKLQVSGSVGGSDHYLIYIPIGNDNIQKVERFDKQGYVDISKV